MRRPDVTELNSHISDRLQTAVPETDPFPCVVIDEFVPDVFLQSLLDQYPSKETFSGGRQTSQSRRNLSYGSELQTQFLNSSAAWAEFANTMESGWFREKLIDVFRDLITAHGGNLSGLEAPGFKYDISLAGDGYTRSVHLDRRNHIIASLFYLNDRSDYGGTGGDLQLFSCARTHPPFDKFPDPSDIAVAKTVEARPNRFVAFLNTSNSYHGISPMREATGFRRFLYIAVDSQSVDDMWPETAVESETRRQQFLSE